jgi:peptide/nickel transport system permease protein
MFFYVGVVAGGILVGLILMAILADVLSPYSPTVQTLSQRLQPPLSSAHLLGTDSLGRDVFSRLLHGSRISLGVAATAVLIGGGIGISLGLLAGYTGGRLDNLIMRIGEVFLGFPLIILAILFASVFGPSFGVVATILALGMWARFARLVRGETLSLKEREFVLAARMAGASSVWIMLRHILPHLVSSILILASLQAAWSIIIEASLSFLGAGVPPPAPSWGGMVNDGRDFLTVAWWLAFFPGLAIVALVLSLNLLGDWARDYLDPRLRRLA